MKADDVYRVLLRKILALEDRIGRVGGVISGGGVGPTDAEYLVGASHPSLSAERVVTDTASVTWDLTTPGQAKANASATVAYAQHVVVAKSGGDFTTIQDAIDSIVDADATKRYVVVVMPGKYSEQVTMSDWIDVVGVDRHAVQIEFSSSSGAVILANSCLLENVLIELTSTEGDYGIVGDNVSNWHIRHVDLLASANTKRSGGIKVTGSSWHTGFIEHVIVNSYTQTNHGIRIESDGADLADVTLNDVFVDSFEATSGGSILFNDLLDTQLRDVFARTSSGGYCIRITGASDVSMTACWCEFGTSSIEVTTSGTTVAIASCAVDSLAVTGGTVWVSGSTVNTWSNSGGTLLGDWGRLAVAQHTIRGADALQVIDATGSTDAKLELHDASTAKGRLWWDQSAPFLILQAIASGVGIVFQTNAGGYFWFNGTSDAMRLLSAGTIELPEQSSSPGTPASGFGRLYVKTDGKIYFKNDSGTETDLTL